MDVSARLTEGFLYDGQLEPVAELDGSGNIVEQFVYGTRPNVPDYIIKSGVEYRVIADQVGSPILIVNASTGAIVEQIGYDAWGNITSDSNPGFQPFGFAGGLYDSDTGLVHFGARDYDPQTGRWISKDPILFAGESTDLYAYAVSDPINFVDPSGLVLEGDSLAALGKFLEAIPDVAALVARASPYLAAFTVGFGIGEAINYACGGECFPGLAVWIYNETHPYPPPPAPVPVFRPLGLIRIQLCKY